MHALTAPQFSDPPSQNVNRRATPAFGHRFATICWNRAMISEQSRNCWGMRTWVPRWSTRMFWTEVSKGSKAHWTIDEQLSEGYIGGTMEAQVARFG